MNTYRCTASALRVRATPGGEDTGRRIGQGELVQVLEQAEGWARVAPPAGPGWVSAAFLVAVVGPSPTMLAAATGMSEADALRWYPHVMEAASRFDFVASRRLAMWLAQCGHESIGFRRLSENLMYVTARQIRATWPSRFPTEDAAIPCVRAPERLANQVYASRLGNGPPESGDGWRYRGRGLIQLTGRANYRVCGEQLGVDLERDPELLTTERWAALSAGWFWASRGLNPFADRGDVEGVTRRVNGGLIGIGDRLLRWERACRALGVTP